MKMVCGISFRPLWNTDLYSANLLSGKHGMYVLDWEVYGEVGLPASDLFTFLISPP